MKFLLVLFVTVSITSLAQGFRNRFFDRPNRYHDNRRPGQIFDRNNDRHRDWHPDRGVDRNRDRDYDRPRDHHRHHHDHEDKHDDWKKIKTCTRKYNEPCYNNKECCNSLVCSNVERRCQCPNGYKYAASIDKCYKCPNNWVFFKNNCYFVSSTRTTWLEAQTACKGMDAQMLSFDSDAIFDDIKGLYLELTLNETIFTGARSVMVPGNWTWPDGRALPGAGPWWSYARDPCFEPANINGTTRLLNQGCSETSGVYLDDILCNDPTKPRKYVCELKNKENIILESQSNDHHHHHHHHHNKKCFGNFQWSEKLKKCVECPPSWVLMNDGCFYASDVAKRWDQADLYCKANKAELFMTNSTNILDVTAELFKRKNLNSESYWIGAQLVNGNFTWNDGRMLPQSGPMWSVCGSPNPDTNLRCVSTFGYGLENLACSSSNKFICKHN